MKFRKDLPESGPGNYVRLKDKESVTGIFRGDIYEFFSMWENGKPKVVNENVFGARFRFKANFVIKEGASYIVKIFEQSQTVYQQLSELHDEYDLEKTLIKITRNGSGKNDTTYTLMPLRQEVPPETLAHIATLPLNPLGPREGTTNPTVGGDAPWPDSASQPWSGSDSPEGGAGFDPSDEIPF